MDDEISLKLNLKLRISKYFGFELMFESWINSKTSCY